MILGGGWGGVVLLKELNFEDWYVIVVSFINYFLFMFMLFLVIVGILGLWSLVELIWRIIYGVRGWFLCVRVEDVDFSVRLVEVS